jgi:hypothetical protein
MVLRTWFKMFTVFKAEIILYLQNQKMNLILKKDWNKTRMILAGLLLIFSVPTLACSLQVTSVISYNCTGNGKDGIVTLNFLNGTAPYTVIFNGTKQTNVSSNSAVFSSLSAGTYTYSIADANACAVSGTAAINKNILPKAMVTSNQTICANAGKSIALGANGIVGNTYSWTSSPAGFFSASSNPSVSPTITTTYTLTEKNPNGCSQSNSVTITVNPVPSVSISSATNSICVGGNSVALTGLPYGGTFAGDGVTDSTFDPGYAGIGNHSITYTYSDGNGCYNSASTVISVVSIPNISFTTPYSSVCIDKGTFSLSATPYGGTFAGDGMSDSIFDPSAAGIGLHTITYYYTSGNGCSFTEMVTVKVNPLPKVSLNNATVCLNNGKFAISSDPSGIGAVYSGDGVSGNIFDPAAAGVGTHTINFAYTDSNGCSSATSAIFTVKPLPYVSIGSYSDICVDAGSFTLTSGSPSGGVYTGDGVNSGVFNPAVAGPGTHIITYTITGANMCQNTATATLTVHALPTLSFSSQTVCINNGKITLKASPTGGSFSGDGISNGTFDPVAAGTGTHTITYSYMDGYGCSNTTTAIFTVNPVPSVFLTASLYTSCTSCGTISLSGTPSGGTFSGTGVSGSSFDPSVSGTGTFTIKYTYSASNGCSNSTTKTITVSANLNVSIDSSSPVCSNAGKINLNGSPTGGSFSGDGVSGSSFNPSAAGPGNHTVTYTYGTQSASTTITVYALPVVSISSHVPVCTSSSSISLSGSPTGGIFSGDGVSGTTFDPSSAGEGAHIITYTYTNANSCVASATTTIQVYTTPNASISASGSTTFCDGGSVILTTQPGFSYAWSNTNGPILGASNQSMTATKSGTYYVSVYNAGCSVNSSGTSVTVNAIPVANAGSDITYYYGYDDCPTLKGSSNISGSSFAWSTGASSQSISVCPTTTANYWLTATSKGCISAKDSVKVTVIDVRCHDEENVEKNNNTKVLICHKGKTICVDKKDVTDHLKHGDKLGTYGSGSIFPEMAISDDQVKIYPNPFTTTTNVGLIFAKDQNVSIDLWSLEGKRVKFIFNGDVSAQSQYNFTLDGSFMMPGIYFVKIISEDHVSYHKIDLVK